MSTTSSSGQTTLLLVDDREENLLALSALLRRDDLTVLCARSGHEALELLLAHDIALALIDVQMPDMDGFELAELMRGSGRTQRVPIIFVTAGSRDSQRVFRGYDAGAVDFLYKPIEPHILRNKVETFVQLDRQRRQLAEQLEQLSETLRLNELFTAVLGHDLRNPLHAVSTVASVLRQMSDDPRVHDTSHRLSAIVMRMSRMIDEMLDLARARLAGGIPIETQAVELSELVARTVEELELAHKGCVIAVDAQGDLRGTWDGDRLMQMISNLLANALQHGTPNAPIILDVDGRQPECVTLSVTSEGAIPQQVLPQLFDPFRSGQNRGRAQGLGLGLYIVQQIAFAHGGTVDVRSNATDGTTFSVMLPRAHVAATADRSRPECAPGRSA